MAISITVVQLLQENLRQDKYVIMGINLFLNIPGKKGSRTDFSNIPIT